MSAKDYSHIVKLEYGSTVFDWSLLPNSKYVLNCTYKEGLFKTTKNFVRMYDGETIERPNGIVSPYNSRAKLLLSGKMPKEETVPCDNLVSLIFYFRHDKPFDTEEFVKSTLEGIKENTC